MCTPISLGLPQCMSDDMVGSRQHQNYSNLEIRHLIVKTPFYKNCIEFTQRACGKLIQLFIVDILFDFMNSLSLFQHIFGYFFHDTPGVAKNRK